MSLNNLRFKLFIYHLAANRFFRADHETETRSAAAAVLQANKHGVPSLLELKGCNVFIDIIPTGSSVLPNILAVDPQASGVIGSNGYQHLSRFVKIKFSIRIIRSEEHTSELQSSVRI